MTQKKKILIITAVILAVFSVLLFTLGGNVTDADVLIKENKAPVASRGKIMNFLNEFAAAVKDHDKEKFLSSFSKNSVIEDPVGVEPFRRGEEIGNASHDAFYESNIAPSEVTFESREDIICGMDVFRDAKITITSAPECTIEVDSYSFYQLTREDGKIKFDCLRAFWEMEKTNMEILSKGFVGMKVSMKLFWVLLKNQGLGGMMGFMKALGGIRAEGKESVAAFAEAVNSNNSDKLLSLFKDENSIIKFAASGKQYNPQSYIDGPFKNSNLTVSDLRSAGWNTACRFNIDKKGSRKKRGIAIFQFSPENEKLIAVHFYWNK